MVWNEKYCSFLRQKFQAFGGKCYFLLHNPFRTVCKLIHTKRVCNLGYYGTSELLYYAVRIILLVQIMQVFFRLKENKNDYYNAHYNTGYRHRISGIDKESYAWISINS